MIAIDFSGLQDAARLQPFWMMRGIGSFSSADHTLAIGVCISRSGAKK
ncbi:Uncharacterised protein [Vibrio cholerae]|nr:Uncharacterised protein [Vibrio cholerae]